MRAAVAAALVGLALANPSPSPNAKPNPSEIFHSLAHCQSHPNASAGFNDMMDKADDVLVPGYFATSVPGWAVLVVDESAAKQTGGGTNPEGSYFGYIFEAYPVLANGMCDDLKRKDIHGGEAPPLCFRQGSKLYTTGTVLGQGDAIAFLGCTPPDMAYFGFDMDIMQRLVNYPDEVTYPGANFADPVNHRRIGTATGSPFDSAALVVQSADGAAADEVRAAFGRLGVPPAAVNFYEVPPRAPVRFYNRSEAWEVDRPDIIASILRMALPQDPEAYERYKTLMWPLRYYISKHPGSHALHPFNYTYIPRANRYNEQALLGRSFRQLTRVVKRRLGDAVGYSFVRDVKGTWQTKGFYDDWDTWLADATPRHRPLMPTRDASYVIRMLPGAGLTQHTGVACLGVLHTRDDTLAAAYQEAILDVFSPINANEFEVVWNQTRLTDSALPFAKDVDLQESDTSRRLWVDHADKFFVVLALPVGGCARLGLAHAPSCVELRPDDTLWFSQESFLQAGERVYVAGDSTIGPDANTGIPMRTIIFETDF
mmetsp:Transcript_35618/g.111956  ORF Transcript_35618/g.111956 Transcript_35618/m.111956 type:complete len:541 (-) Transcript_35618:32-1654(-)